MEKWDLSKMPNLQGKLVVVTGANVGLGFESVKSFASKGAEVVMACRNTEKGEVAKSKILNQYPDSKLFVRELDLMDLKSVKTFAERFKEENTKLDILLNNAGIMTSPYFLTKDGFEAQFGTNHLGHFALTAQLFEIIASTSGSRIINVSSIAHRGGVINFGDINYSEGKKYSPMTAYKRSKISNLYFTYELERRIKERNLDVKVLAAHPGVSNTNLAQFLEDKWWFNFLYPIMKPLFQTPEMGALPQIRAAVDESAKSGQYYGPGGFNEMSGNPVLVRPRKEAQDPEIANKLWTLSEELCDLEFKLN